jgi:hypothetical protein
VTPNARSPLYACRKEKTGLRYREREGIEKLLLLFLFLLLVFIFSHSFSDLPGNGSAEDLSTEETALGSLDDLLVN